MSHRIDFATARELLKSGAILLTANNRLAGHLSGRFAEAMSAGGAVVWETPDILPLGAWLNRAYQLLVEDGHASLRLLTPHQQRLLWERLVKDSEAGDRLLRPDAAAALAAEAWERLCAWNLELNTVDASAGEEARAFRNWARYFVDECHTNGWLDAARLPAVLGDAIRDVRLALPDAVIFAGFEELTPAVARLAEQMEQAGCAVNELAADIRTAPATRIGVQDKQAELRVAASWAAHRISDNPRARLGIVIPDLGQRRAQVMRALDGLLHPRSSLSPREPTERSYNISLGQPLSEYPLINDALLALRLLIQGLELADTSTLLRSPYVGEGDSEYLARCRLEEILRDWPDQRIPAHRIHNLAETACPALAGRLVQGARALEGGSGSPAVWSERFRNALSAFGWPGERGLDSSEYQQVQRLRDLVDDLPALAAVEPRMDARRALACLADLVRHTTFQPESRSTGAIQVMGLLEADGQSFDGLWITGLSDQQYPPPAEPHPLLPVALQRRHSMPHASAERELGFASRLLERLLGAAPEVVVSWPRRDEDRELLPTPLIMPLPEHSPEELGIRWLDRLDERWLKQSALMELEDRGVAVDKDGIVAGGTRLLLDQAACPFRAYAHHRLHAARLADPAPGPSPLVRGNLLHAALEAFWNAIGSHQQLLALDEDALRLRIGDAVEEALADAGRDLAGEARRLEERRLARRLAAWIGIERHRAPFTVTATEQRSEVNVGGLRLNTLADRVDRLDDGRLVVIDYKSGDARRDGWLGGRLFEPQLPLYAVTLEDGPVAAVSFAKLKPDDTRFLGTAEDDDLLPGVAALTRDRQRGDIADWSALLGHWRTELEELAGEVLQGLAVVTPKKPDACTWCDLGDLCRIAKVSDDQPNGEENDG